MAQPKQSNDGCAGFLIAGAAIFFIYMITSFFSDGKPQTIDATDPTWISEQTKRIPVYKEQEAVADLKSYAVQCNYDQLSRQDRDLFWQEVADRHDMSVNQLKACANKHK